jgi:hypothetical protein
VGLEKMQYTARAGRPAPLRSLDMDSRQAPLTAATLTTKGTARLPNRGSIS